MAKELKLHLAAGKAETEKGWTAVDKVEYKGIKVVHDLTTPWPWKDNSVDEVRCRYLLQYLTPAQRMFFMNELHRVLKPQAKAILITPHWCSNTAMADLSACWPPIAESWFLHLNKDWREQNAYWEEGYTCDFDFTVGYGLHQSLVTRNNEYREQAVTFWKEAAQDTIATVIKR